MASAMVYVAAYAPMRSFPFSLENHSCYPQVCARNYRYLRGHYNFIKTKKLIRSSNSYITLIFDVSILP